MIAIYAIKNTKRLRLKYSYDIQKINDPRKRM